MFIRYESCIPNHRGLCPGIYAMANGLARAGKLTADEYHSWQQNNFELDSAYHSPEIYKTSGQQGLTSWYKEEQASSLLKTIGFYTGLLDSRGIPWRVIRSQRPGEIVYEDEFQVVVSPFTFKEHWNL